jgi:hypothetical protein
MKDFFQQYALRGFLGTSGGDGTTVSQKAVLYTPQNLTDEQKAQARENIGIGDGLSGGGNANICNFTVTSEQEVNGITVELPTTLNKFYVINFHIQFASGLTGEMVLYSNQGDGYWKCYNDRLPEGARDVSLFGLFYSREYLNLGMRIAPFGALASPAMGDIALNVSQNDKTITFFSHTAGVNFPAGSSISVWGVYEQ